MAIGQAGMGLSCLFISVVSCVELNTAVVEKYGQEKAVDLADSVSAIFSIILNLGNIIGALYSQTVYDAYGFRVVNEIIGGLIILNIFIYILLTKLGKKKLIEEEEKLELDDQNL